MIDTLSSELQEIIKFNYQYFSNFFFLLMIFIISCTYIFYIKPYFETKTPYMSKGIMRLFLTGVSYISLFLTPFMAFFINPEISDNAIINTYMIIYTTYLTLIIILSILDALRYTPSVILKYGGIDIGDKDGNRVFKNINDEMEKLPFIRWFSGRK